MDGTSVTLTDCLKIFFERSVAVQTLWNIDIAVCVGAITFICTARKAFIRPSLRLILIAAFSIFSLSNLDAISQVNAERIIILKQIKKIIGENPDGIDKVMAPTSMPVLFVFHICFALLVVYLIYVIPVVHKSKFLGWLDRLLQCLRGKIGAILLKSGRKIST